MKLVSTSIWPTTDATWPASVASFALLVVFGLFYLPYPLNSDNALFLTVARELSEGARLYVDFWDVKQPGVFWLYLSAGTVFGFNAPSVHLFELIWLLAATVIIWHTAHRYFPRENAAVALVPLLTAGVYYLTARLWFFGQVEILVALPLSGCLLAGTLAAKNGASHWRWGALFGLCAAMVAALKLLLIIVPSAMGLAVIALVWDRNKRILQPAIVRFFLPAVIGLVIPLSGVALYFYSVDSWEPFWWTQFVYPPLALLQVEGEALARLVDEGEWIVAILLPAVPIIALASRTLRKAPPRTDEILALVWLITGLVATLLQRNSWHGYNFLLLLFPSGYLVCSAINRFLGPFPSLQRRGIVVATVALICVLASVKQIPDRWNALWAALEAPAGEGLDRFREALKPGYIDDRMVAERVQGRLHSPMTMAVLGDADIIRMAGVPLGLSINGSTVGYLLPEQQEDYIQDFFTKKPEYVFLENHRPARERVVYRRLGQFLNEEYRVVLESKQGILYERVR